MLAWCGKSIIHRVRIRKPCFGVGRWTGVGWCVGALALGCVIELRDTKYLRREGRAGRCCVVHEDLSWWNLMMQTVSIFLVGTYSRTVYVLGDLDRDLWDTPFITSLTLSSCRE